MEFERDVNFRCVTAGKGLWSEVRKTITINKVILAYADDEEMFGELRAYFDPSEWDTNNEGLIYTDPFWLECFRSCMLTLGFSQQAVNAIDYSEAGMQGETYISLDVTEDFMLECTPLYRFTINREAVNS
jgi:hypothetical protein